MGGKKQGTEELEFRMEGGDMMLWGGGVILSLFFSVHVGEFPELLLQYQTIVYVFIQTNLKTEDSDKMSRL